MCSTSYYFLYRTKETPSYTAACSTEGTLSIIESALKEMGSNRSFHPVAVHVDETKAPKFHLEKADSDEYCIMHFSDGPPYEDSARSRSSIESGTDLESMDLVRNSSAVSFRSTSPLLRTGIDGSTMQS